ncbi:MAG: serine hydrolase [Pseudomonadota bacterium]
MGKWLKRGAYALGLLVAVAVIAALIWREELERLYRVNTLFDEDRIVQNFSNMRTMFEATDIPRAGPLFEFGSDPRDLPEKFDGPDGPINTEAFLAETKTTSLLVMRDDAIEFEGYYLGTGAEDQRISWSVAKSFLSALLGIAIGEGKIDSMDDPVTKYVPALTGSAYDGVSLREAANMASGVRFNEDYADFNSDINRMGRELALGGSLDEFAAGLGDRIGPAGQQWVYVSIDTHVLGMALRAATGKPVAEYMTEKLWSKIGAEADAYYVTDGFNAAFVLGGLNMRTRDYARFGRVMLNDGVVDGVEILPPGWALESTAQSAPDAAGGSVNQPYGYGYQWWLPPNADEEVFGVGVYDQYLWFDRKAGVIIVKTSANRDFRANRSQHRVETMALFRALSRP